MHLSHTVAAHVACTSVLRHTQDAVVINCCNHSAPAHRLSQCLPVTWSRCPTRPSSPLTDPLKSRNRRWSNHSWGIGEGMTRGFITSQRRWQRLACPHVGHASSACPNYLTRSNDEQTWSRALSHPVWSIKEVVRVGSCMRSTALGAAANTHSKVAYAVASAAEIGPTAGGSQGCNPSFGNISSFCMATSQSSVPS